MLMHGIIILLLTWAYSKVVLHRIFIPTLKIIRAYSSVAEYGIRIAETAVRFRLSPYKKYKISVGASC